MRTLITHKVIFSLKGYWNFSWIKRSVFTYIIKTYLKINKKCQFILFINIRNDYIHLYRINFIFERDLSLITYF